MIMIPTPPPINHSQVYSGNKSIDNASFRTTTRNKPQLSPRQSNDIHLARFLNERAAKLEGWDEVGGSVNMFAVLKECGIDAHHVACLTLGTPYDEMFSTSSTVSYVEVHGQAIHGFRPLAPEGLESSAIHMHDTTREEIEHYNKHRVFQQICASRANRDVADHLTRHDIRWTSVFEVVHSLEHAPQLEQWLDASRTSQLHGLALAWTTLGVNSCLDHPRRL